jgi:hypothetical protein
MSCCTGGAQAGAVQRLDHELEPWEKRCHALADVLVEALGSQMADKLSYYERWIAPPSRSLLF